MAENIDIEVKYTDGIQHTYLEGKDVSEEIRNNEISMLASTVSAVRCVREASIPEQVSYPYPQKLKLLYTFLTTR